MATRKETQLKRSFPLTQLLVIWLKGNDYWKQNVSGFRGDLEKFPRQFKDFTLFREFAEYELRYDLEKKEIKSQYHLPEIASAITELNAANPKAAPEVFFCKLHRFLLPEPTVW